MVKRFSFLLFLGLVLPLSAATVSISNLTHPANPNLQVNDTFKIAITGGAPSSAVQVCAMKNGIGQGCSNAGTTDGSGVFSEQGTETAGFEGYWVETWSVAGVQASPTLTFFVGSNVPPTIYGLNGGTHTTSVAFWYLGGAPSIDGYYIQWPVYVTTNSSDASPTITWTTDSPSRLSITPVSGGATLNSTGASVYGAGYDVHVTVRVDGVASASFPVLLDTPYTMTTHDSGEVCSGGVCDCPVFHLGPYGYVNAVKHFIADLNGATLLPITTNESLEKQQILNSTYSSFPSPSASTWPTSDWSRTDDSFTDSFLACTSSNTGLVPPLSTYNPNGTSQIFNETQKFWVGSGSHFQGVCVQRGVVTLYTDHGRIYPYYSPITNKPDCNPGNVLN